ncbi:MAG: oligosaccharide flippase family protein, partial [Pseudomonadota bacterium]
MDQKTGASKIKKLLNTIIMLCSSQIAVAIIALTKNKVLAIILGPVGIGLIAQLTASQNFIATVVPMGMQIGATAQLSRLNDRTLLAQCLATSSKVFLWLSFATMVVCFFFIKPITALTLGTSDLFMYMIPALLGIPFLIQTNVWVSYFQARLELKTLAKVSVAGSFLGLLFLIPMVLIWGQWGAVLNVFLVALLGYFAASAYARQLIPRDMKAEIKSSLFDLQTLRVMFRYGYANMPVFALDIGIPFLIRAQIINDLGLTANGIYQAVLAIPSLIMTMPFNALATYAFPKLSKLNSWKEINAEVNTFVKIMFLIATLSSLVILTIRDVAINLLYSKEFSLAICFLSWQTIGEYLKAVTMTIQFPLQPQEKFKARNIINGLQKAIFLIIFYLPSATMRLEGAVWGFAASWAFTLAAMYAYTNRVNGFKFTPENWRLFVTGNAAVF